MSKLLELLHGGPLDGYKKGISVLITLLSPYVLQKYPEAAPVLALLTQIFGVWGISSDVLKKVS